MKRRTEATVTAEGLVIGDFRKPFECKSFLQLVDGVN